MLRYLKKDAARAKKVVAIAMAKMRDRERRAAQTERSTGRRAECRSSAGLVLRSRTCDAGKREGAVAAHRGGATAG